MSGIHCFTSFTFGYLGRALILVRTLRKAHPDWTIWALLVDKPPAGMADNTGLERFDRVLYADELDIPHFKSWLFKHDIVEACTAVKGEMTRYLLRQGAEKVVYFDPDIALFHPISDIIDRLDTSSVVLTPHQVHPNDSRGYINDFEMTSLKYGIYNLGFLAIRSDSTGFEFADWWANQLYFACYDDIPNGLFTDQKWCDLVPVLFSNVYIERDPGCNVASWNISTRNVSVERGGRITVNGSPLKFYHFTKVNSEGDIMTDKYAGDNVGVLEVWSWYKRQLQRNLDTRIPSRYWAYSAFENGVEITKAARVLFRSRRDIMEYFCDPYATKGDCYYDWLGREHPEILVPS